MTKHFFAMVMDRRWQLVLDCLDCEQAPFGKGTLVRFRAALIASSSDRSLLERTIELAAKTKGYNSNALRAALDSWTGAINGIKLQVWATWLFYAVKVIFLSVSPAYKTSAQLIKNLFLSR